MKTGHSSNERAKGEVGSADVAEILDGLRPRMRAARIRHVRFIGAIVAIVPLVGFGAVAFGQEGSGESVSVASGGVSESEGTAADEHVATDIGGGGGNEEATAPDGADHPDSDLDMSDDGSGDGDEPASEPENRVQEVEMETYGAVKVKVDDGGVTLVEALIEDPWEFVSAETNDEGDLIISVSDGDSIKLIIISEGLWDRIHIRFDDFIVPTTTVKPEPRPEPRPEPPPVVDRIELEVPPAGWFVVEREGEVLWAGNVNPNEGFDYDIIEAEGWKVHVVFVNETHLFHGKAYITDHGELVTETWTEEREVVAEPVYQWVEIPEVGVVQFKYHDGLMYVVAIEAFEGFGSYVYNEVGEESVKVDFEGEGLLWIVEAWEVEGTIQWSTVGP